MSPLVLVAIVLLCVLVAAFFIWLWVWMERNEKETVAYQAELRQKYDRAYAEIQQRYGWQIEPTMDPQLKALFPFAARKKAKTVFAGQWRGRAFGVFKYTTETEGASNEVSAAFGDGGRTAYTLPHWAVVVAIPVNLPEMRLRKGSSVRPENPGLLGRLLTPPPPLGDEAFDRRFIVIAKDRSAIPAVFTPQIRHFVLADPRVPDAHLGFWQSNIYAEIDDRFTPETIDQIVPKLDLLCDFLDRLYPTR